MNWANHVAIEHDHSINQARYASKALEGQLDIA